MYNFIKEYFKAVYMWGEKFIDEDEEYTVVYIKYEEVVDDMWGNSMSFYETRELPLATIYRYMVDMKYNPCK